jgi:hypothetical protein
MTRHTLLDLLGTTQLTREIEQQFVDFCVWEQAAPACVRILKHTGLTAEARTIAAIHRDAAHLALQARHAADKVLLAGLEAMPLAAIQGMTSEVDQLVAAAQPGDGTPDASAVSFHAARLMGWASWTENDFGTGLYKASAENIAFAEQLQQLMTLLGTPGF